jgi:sorting nexin-1/2
MRLTESLIRKLIIIKNFLNPDDEQWEGKVARSQEDFEKISKNVKGEVEKFEIVRIRDFKSNIVKYLESLLDTQQQIIKHWEAFLPEAKAIA